MPRFAPLPVLCVLIALAAAPVRAGTLGFSPSTYDFGYASVSAGATTGSLTITNTGSSTTITGITTSGSCAEFTVTPALQYPIVLGSNQSVTVQLAYDPANRVSDQCNCTTVDGNGLSDTFILRGDGAAPQLQVAQAVLNFADQAWNATVHETLSVTVENVGEEVFTAANLGRVLSTGTHFSLGPTVGSFPVQTGEMVSIPVIFDPTSTGAKSDLLTISLTNDSPSDINPAVSLSGNGTATVDVEPTPGAGSGIRSVGPSPTRGWVRVQATLDAAGELAVEIWDLAGRRVASARTPQAGPGHRTVEFRAGRDWSPAPGVYLVSVGLGDRLLGVRRIVMLK